MKAEIADDRFVRLATQPGSRRVSRVDLCIGAGLAVATLAISLYFAPRGFHLGFVDMGHDGYQLRQMIDLSEGAVIFRDTFDQYGPLSGYLNAAGFMALGRRLLAVKYFLCGWYALIAVMLYAMARRWLNPALAAFSTIVWLGLAPFYQHGIMISAHVYVLFFQTVATLVALRAPRLEAKRFAIVGVLAGLSALSKLSMGVSFIASILLYLSLRLVKERDDWRRVANATAAVLIGFSSVLGIVFALLWMTGALSDWYLQTVAFPRQFYLHYAHPAVSGSGLFARLVPPSIANFVVVQSEQALYWWVIRAVVVMTAVVQLVRRRSDNDLLLMASITGVLWVGIYVSLNFMHQWWTASLSFAPFVMCIRAALKGLAASDRARSWAAAAIVLLIVGAGIIDRKNAAVVRADTLTETIAEPAVFRGIRTDAATKRAFETLNRRIVSYRSQHPGTKLVTVDESDGWWTGINESLPFLSFFDGNTHPHPVYWSLPVLATVIYPGYKDALWSDVKTGHPLIIEQHAGWYKPRRIPGYTVLAAAQNDGGHWYLYAPDHEDRLQHGEVSTYLARDGKTESGFAEHDAVPQLSKRLSSNVEAAWRGRVAQSSTQSDKSVELPGTFPLVVHDQALANARAPINVYTWPTDLPIASLDATIEPMSSDPAARADIVRDLGAGAWTVDGYAPGQYTYLLEFREAPMAVGTYFVIRGELQEGGFTVGFLQDNQWSTYVNVTRPGLFEAVLQIQTPGRYALTVANCLETTWWQRGWRYRLRNRIGLGKVGPNRFRVTEAGWIQPSEHPQ
jgi:Dolichyl-phosphate-mannose-protein mannosyltransferase